MPDRESDIATATLQTAAGTEEVRVELNKFERSLAIHAIACASGEVKPGRTLARRVVWRAR